VTARSIFQKVCPECMATVPLDTRECICGHLLDHDDTDAALTSEEIRLKAEELYENYLGARVDQAAKAVQTAQADFARDPSSEIKSDHVASTINELQMAESELAAQSARVAEMKKAIPPKTRPAVPVPVASPAKKRVAALKAVATTPQARITRKPIPVLTEVVAAAPPRPRHEPKAVTAPKHAAKVIAMAEAPPRPKHEPKAVTQPKQTVRVVTPVPEKSPVIAMAEAPPRLKHEPKTVTQPKQKVRVVTPVPEKSPVIAATPGKPDFVPPVQSATPNPAFRQAQAARAEKILRAKSAPVPSVVKPVKEETRMMPVVEPEPAQTTPIITAKSAPRLYSPRDKKDCPNCTASVVIAAARCRCGYEFPSSEQLIPALTMSDEERAEFAKLFGIP